MSLIKHGTGEIVTDAGKKTASSKEQTEQEREALKRENEQIDSADD